MNKDIAKAITDLSNKVNQAQKAINDRLGNRCKNTEDGLTETKADVSENNDAILETAECISDESECMDELATVISDVSECIDELSEILSDFDARLTALEEG